MSGHRALPDLNAEAINLAAGKFIDYGTTVPADGGKGYAPGCTFYDLDAAGGAQLFINEGSATSCAFKAIDSVSSTNTLTNKTLTSPTINTPTIAAPTISAGSATAASWPTLASGTVLTTAENGAIERDASVFYASTAAAQRGVLPAVQFVYQSAAFVLANGNSAQACFTAAQDTLTVRAATTYLFEAFISMTTGATSHTVSMLFAGNATLTSISYGAISSTAAAATLAAAQCTEVEVATAVVVIAATTAVRQRIHLFGSVQINAAGTLIPQIQFSADPTGTCQTNIGSYFRLYPIGTNLVTSVGPWA